MFFMANPTYKNQFAVLKTHVHIHIHIHIHIYIYISVCVYVYICMIIYVCNTPYQLGMSENGVHPKMTLEIRK